MNYKKISCKDFILYGLKNNMLITKKESSKILNELNDYNYDNSFIFYDKTNWDKEYFLYLKNKSLEVNTFCKINEIYDVHEQKKQNNESYKKNLPKGLLEINSDTNIFNRDKEKNLLNIILNKKIRSNIILVGEAGVGKTKLIQSINFKAVSLDTASLISGTEYRGRFESNLRDIIDYCIDNQIILFIDEIHSLYNLGLSEGGISALDILKPFLSSGKLSIIGATTIKELKKIEKDVAFKRRFTTIKLNPITREEIINNLANFTTKFNFEIENSESIILLDKALTLFGEYRLLDGFLDMLDTLDSYCKINKIKKINNYIIKEVDYIWESMY